MSAVKLKIDVSGTVGDEAWHSLRHFELAESSSIDFRTQSGSTCDHPAGEWHLDGEYVGAEIHLDTMLLAQYAVSHYLEQDRVLDADVEAD
jgi:hypothetical protein